MSEWVAQTCSSRHVIRLSKCWRCCAVPLRCALQGTHRGQEEEDFSLSLLHWAAYNNIYMYMRVISWRDGAGWYPTGRETINQRLNSHLSELWIERVKKQKKLLPFPSCQVKEISLLFLFLIIYEMKKLRIQVIYLFIGYVDERDLVGALWGK